MFRLGLVILSIILHVSLSFASKEFNEQLVIEKGENDEGRTIILLNGSKNNFGPTYTVTPESYFELTIHNNLCSIKEYEETQDLLYKQYCEVSIHFHGLVPLPNNVDGIPNITQNPIKPGDSYTYKFQIPKNACGTYWYHSHSSVQYGDGLRGIFIVECSEMDQLLEEVVRTLDDAEILSLNEGSLSIIDKNKQEEEKLFKGVQEEIITLSDYYNGWNFDVFSQRVMSPNGDPDPRVENSLINGNKFDNIMKELKPGTRYLKIRIINTGMSGTQIFNIQNHKFVVIETDGVLIEPYVLETLSMAVGQRYTIIVKLKEKEDYMHVINGCGKMMGYVKKSMWFVKSGVSLEDVEMNSNIEIKHLPGFNKHELYQGLTPHPRTNLHYYENYTESITLDYEYSKDIIPEYNTRLYLVNGLPFQEYVKQPYQFKLRDNGESNVLQIIINSVDHMRHPWHLHGFDFQVVSMGIGGEGPLYLEKTGSSAYKKFLNDLRHWEVVDKIPMTRDSINIPGNSYAVIRLMPNRLGKWLFHCHVEWHMGKGLGYIIDVINDTTTSPITPLNQTSKTLSNNNINKFKVIAIYLLIMIAINGTIYFTICS